jgi:transcriptional regulator with XRE-family HTH domain
MTKKNSYSPEFYTKLKGVVKSLGLDQAGLAEKIGSNPASISKALNGSNEKTLHSIIQLLEREYGITSLNQHLESSLDQGISTIRSELQDIKTTLSRMEQNIEQLQQILLQTNKKA